MRGFLWCRWFGVTRMGNNMHANNANFAVTECAQRPPDVRARRAAWPLDARTRESRKLRLLATELGHRFSVSADDPTLLRAAELALAASIARRELIRGAPGASVEGLVKLENLARRAALDVSNKAKDKPNTGPTLQEYLAAKAAAAPEAV
jgi:hypothetical protein